MFHRVVENRRPRAFSPNAQFSVTPGVLRSSIRALKRSGFEPVGLNEAHRRLTEGGGPFSVLTFDDAYRDSAELAWPICREERTPLVVYLTTGLVSRCAPVWWYGLERLIETRDHIEGELAGKTRPFRTDDPVGKFKAYREISHAIRSADPSTSRALVDALSALNRFDVVGWARDWVMDWDDVRALSRRPEVEFGAHTVHHLSLADQTEDIATRELDDSRREIEHELGLPCAHAAFPFGDPDTTGPREFALADKLGFRTATTTRHGVLRNHRQLTALPRIPSDPFDTMSTVAAKISGLPAALLGRAG